MLSDFIVCVNAIVPSAIYLLIGILLKVFRVIDDEGVKKFTHVTFVTLFPFMMFDNIYGKNLEDNFDVKIILFAIGFTAFQIISSWLFVCAIEKDNYNRGAMIQALFRSNIVLMGLPTMINLLGKANVVPMALIILVVVPTYNTVAVVIFERFRGGTVSAGHMAKKIATNPIIIGGVTALVLILLNITLPEKVAATAESLSDCTAPISMILLGASLNRQEINTDKIRLVICITGKLVVFPVLGMASAIFFGFRGSALVAITLMSAAPVALSSYAMASSMGGNGKFSGAVVVVSTILSCFTIPVWLFVLKTGGFF